MITIVKKRNTKVTITVKVCNNPTLGTWGSHQLLLQEYKLSDEDDDHWGQAKFNMRFLKDKEIDYGPLWCSYCGKEELRIYGFHEAQHRHNMATADHIIPKSEAPELARDRSNMTVACWKCNMKKGTKKWGIKFPYD